MDLLLAYYGDDLTGSTDVLEALSTAGIETVLFVDAPSDELLQRYAHVRAVGIAGTGRTMSPAEMDAALPDVFCWFARLGPKFIHYKTCSTFDSSPQVGSIGRAIDIGQQVFQNRCVPLVVGAPSLQRFCVFGNLFARSGLDSPPFRLDRHPTMRRHPVTPMTEADLGLHLAQQTDRSIELVDVLMLDRGHETVANALAQFASGAGPVVLFDTLTDAHLATIGRALCDAQQQVGRTQFVAGSSGMEYALTKHWSAAGVISRSESQQASRIERQVHEPQPVLVVSGSLSPVTKRQIDWAVQRGFAAVPVEAGDVWAVGERAAKELSSGRSVIVHTHGSNAPHSGDMNRSSIGGILGQVIRQVLDRVPLWRVAVAGGDTAGEVARELGIEALEFSRPWAPGAPLCIARGSDPRVDGLEITFKGGQVGRDNAFETLLDGPQSNVG